MTQTKGLITLKIKISGQEEYVDVLIVGRDDFEDFIIGLNVIKRFKLIQDEYLQNTEIQIKSMKTVHKEDIKEIKVNFTECINGDELKINLSHLDSIKKKKIETLIKRYNTVSAKNKYDAGTVKNYKARIDLLVEKYCSKRPYRCTIKDKKEIDNPVAKLLENKMIEESYSLFAAPIILAFKRNENKRERLCIDFGELNKIVVPQTEPFPLINDLILKTRNEDISQRINLVNPGT